MDPREELAMNEILDYAKRWHGVHGIGPEFKIALVETLMRELGVKIETRFTYSLKAMSYSGRFGTDEYCGE